MHNVSKMHEAYGGVCHIFWHLYKEVVLAEMPASMLQNLRSRLVTTHLRRKSILPTNLGWKIPAERKASASTSAAVPVSQEAEREPATGETTARATSHHMANVPHAGSVSCAHTAQRDFSSAESCCPLEIQPISQTTQPTGLYLCAFECSSKKAADDRRAESKPDCNRTQEQQV